MAWTDPDDLTTTTGEVLGSADLILIRDNFKFLYDPPTITVRLTGAQEVASADDHTVQWDEATWDTSDAGMWDAGTPGSVVIDRPGVYLIVAQHQWEGTSDDNSKRSLRLFKNGDAVDTDDLGGDDRLSTSSPIGSGAIITSLAADDFLEFVARQLSGSAIDLQAYRTRATVTWLRPNPS